MQSLRFLPWTKTLPGTNFMICLDRDQLSLKSYMAKKNLEVVLTRSNSSDKNKSSSPNINKNKIHANRGVDFILYGGVKKQPKNIHILFDKMVCFFKREVTIKLEFSFSIRKKR